VRSELEEAEAENLTYHESLVGWVNSFLSAGTNGNEAADAGANAGGGSGGHITSLAGLADGSKLNLVMQEIEYLAPGEDLACSGNGNRDSSSGGSMEGDGGDGGGSLLVNDAAANNFSDLFDRLAVFFGPSPSVADILRETRRLLVKRRRRSRRNKGNSEAAGTGEGEEGAGGEGGGEIIEGLVRTTELLLVCAVQGGRREYFVREIMGMPLRQQGHLMEAIGRIFENLPALRIEEGGGGGGNGMHGGDMGGDGECKDAAMDHHQHCRCRGRLERQIKALTEAHDEAQNDLTTFDTRHASEMALMEERHADFKSQATQDELGTCKFGLLGGKIHRFTLYISALTLVIPPPRLLLSPHLPFSPLFPLFPL
jgi:hypothetical protein